MFDLVLVFFSVCTGCKTLFEHSLFKRWGKKHCCNCFYCNSTSKTVVTDVFEGKQEEFCGNDCLLKQKLLNHQVIFYCLLMQLSGLFSYVDVYVVCYLFNLFL